MKDLILFPFNGNAREAISAIGSLNRIAKQWKLVGFIDDSEQLWGKKFGGAMVIGGKAKFKSYPSAHLLAVPGSPESFLRRDKIIRSFQCSSERYATIVDSRWSGI